MVISYTLYFTLLICNVIKIPSKIISLPARTFKVPGKQFYVNQVTFQNTGSITLLLSQRRLTEVDNVRLRRYSVRETRVIPRVLINTILKY